MNPAPLDRRLSFKKCSNFAQKLQNVDLTPQTPKYALPVGKNFAVQPVTVNDYAPSSQAKIKEIITTFAVQRDVKAVIGECGVTGFVSVVEQVFTRLYPNTIYVAYSSEEDEEEEDERRQLEKEPTPSPSPRRPRQHTKQPALIANPTVPVSDTPKTYISERDGKEYINMKAYKTYGLCGILSNTQNRGE